jgi:hypothetical protein
MGIQGCPSDPLVSNDVCSRGAPLFKLYVVSDTDAQFSMEVLILGKAAHKTNKQSIIFNPPTSATGSTYKQNFTNGAKGDIFNATFQKLNNK